MKIIKFAASILAGSLALVANNTYAAAAAYPISISFTTYNQVTSTNSSGVITYSTTSTTWNNATILAKLQSLGVTLPPGPKLAVIKGGDIVVLDANGNIGLNLDGLNTDTYEVYLYLDDITPLVQTTKSAKLSSTTIYSGTASFYADFVSYTNDVAPSAVKPAAVKPHGGFSTSSEDAFDFFTLSISGSFVRAAASSNASTSVPLAAGSMSVWGSGEYYHYDTTVGDIYQPADTTDLVPLITGAQNNTLLSGFYQF